MNDRFFSAVSLVFSSAVLLCSCGPSLEVGEDAQIHVDPSKQLSFSRVKVGETRTQPLVISNVGVDPLNVKNIEWLGADSVSLSIEGSGLPRTLEKFGQFAVSVAFSPTKDAPAPDGVIRIYSNDIDDPIYDVDVVASQLPPQIHVMPSAEEKLIFGQVDAGNTLMRSVVVTNTGDLPLDISKISLVAPDDFSLSESPTVPLRLNAGESKLTLNVGFSPTTSGRAEGNLVFTSNDPINPTYTLPIVANSDTPCISVQPTIVEFSPAVSIGTTSSREVSLISCSSVPLTISSVLKSSGDDVFSYELIGADFPLENGQAATLRINYSPVREGQNKVEYVVESNDPLQPNARISVLASASSNMPPTAVVRARINAASDWSRTKIDVAPLDTIILDGSHSSDPEQSNLSYYWSVKSAPVDSTSKISANGAQASFFVDLADNYEICLNVEDDAKLSNQDCITVSAVPRETLHVQLVWSTPADETIGDDKGTDLDLHFVRLLQGSDVDNPNVREGKGTWFDKGDPFSNDGTDIYFDNKSAAWTIEGIGTEKPSLDRDDKDGEGPENINLDKPAPCSWYAIGVHYFKDNALGPSYATVRVYVSGKKRFEQAKTIVLDETGAFKQVAIMYWDGSTARVYDTLYAYDNYEACEGKAPIVPEDVVEKAKKSAPQCFQN